MFVRWPQIIAAACLTLQALRPSSGSETVQFNYRLPQVGQQGLHELNIDLKLNITLRQQGKAVSSDQRAFHRVQERRLTILEMTGDRATRVRVDFVKARESTARASPDSEERPLCIEGKSYVVQRRAAELLITDSEGNQVSAEESTLIAAAMDAVGRQNALARYLHGRSVAVGETLNLPKEVAGDLLGLRDAAGDVQNIDLKLKTVRVEAGRRIAEFETAVAFQRGAGQALTAQGSLTIDVETCQAIAADFSGPVCGKQEQASDGEPFAVETDGILTASVRSKTLR